jgi:hypothetical protein
VSACGRGEVAISGGDGCCKSAGKALEKHDVSIIQQKFTIVETMYPFLYNFVEKWRY